MLTEVVTVCPVCEGTIWHPFLQCRDHTVSKSVFDLNRCVNCGFTVTSPRPKELAIGPYYQSETYISHSDTRKGFISKAYHLVRQWTLKQKLNLINDLMPQKGRLLDVGCGTGLFLATCQKAGWQVQGVEPDAKALEYAEAATNTVVQNNLWKLSRTVRYQVISMWHVLEHVHKLSETLAWLTDHLDTNGKLVIAVPNHLSYDAQQFGAEWAAYDVPRHLYHFSPQTLPRLARRYGLELHSIKPMLFDSYYVSLLSTQYKYERVQYLRALWTGFRSNRQASQTGNYSSLIFVFIKGKTAEK